MSREAADLLNRVHRRIRAPERHTKGVMARDARGDACQPTDPNATCWCFFGALMAEAAQPGESHIDAGTIMQVAAGRLDVDALNDRWNGHARILRTIDMAIAIAKSEACPCSACLQKRAATPSVRSAA